MVYNRNLIENQLDTIHNIGLFFDNSFKTKVYLDLMPVDVWMEAG
jgi:hypothetical protein